MALRSRLALIAIVLAIQNRPSPCEEVTCNSVFIQNKPNMTFEYKATGAEVLDQHYYNRCTVIEGDFGISLITNLEFVNYTYIQFPNVREITGSLWIFQAKGLRSLRDVLPNLRVIGGQTLLMHYSLVVYQNEYLEDIGLSKLTAIRNGGIRVMQNAQLCYTRNIDWSQLTFGPISQIRSDLVSRMATCENPDPVCGPREKAKREKTCNLVDSKLSCWDAESCQTKCKHGIYYVGKEKRIGPGCDPLGRRCHEACFGGCERPGDASRCYSCKNVYLDGRCVDKCPPHMFEYMNRRCVTEEECWRMNPQNDNYFKALNGKCDSVCPEGYVPEEGPEDSFAHRHKCKKCAGSCLRICHTIKVVDTVEKALELSKCHVIAGSLEISLYSIDVDPEEKLREAFARITEITDYLLIRFSPFFKSLDMLPNLRKIHGKRVYNNRYALVVVECPNFFELSEPNRIQILNGTVMLNNNEKLCSRVIDRFLKSTNLTVRPDQTDISPFSNGDGANCADADFDVAVTEVFDYGFSLQWTPFDTSGMDHRQFFGYTIFYKNVSSPNITIDITADRSNECSDTWDSAYFFEDPHGPRITHGFVSARPDTYYAYYVQPRLSRYTKARKSISPVGFVKTRFGKPDAPTRLASSSTAPDSIELKWTPPPEEKARGRITHYQVSWVQESQRERLVDYVCSHEMQAQILRSGSRSSYRKSLSPAQSAETDQCSATTGCCECAKSSEMLKDIAVDERNGTRIPVSRKRRSINGTVDDKSITGTVDDKHHLNTPPNPDRSTHYVTAHQLSHGTINVTNLHLKLMNMRHYTFYIVGVSACHDVKVEGARCSPYKITRIRTLARPTEDLINSTTIRKEIRNSTETTELFISWDHPNDPNGAVYGYMVKIGLKDKMSASEVCVSKEQFDREGGANASVNADGSYYVEVRTISMARLSNPVTKYDVFQIVTPSFWTLERTLIAFCVSAVLLMGVVMGIGRFSKYYIGGKMQEYWRQTVAANPYYLSQMEVYKPDEWEIPRSVLTIHEEIGRGTFGKVLRGTADNFKTVKGQIFGECAIKTVTENTSEADQVHFLFEGSVMKRFNTDFIVKLYGIVSDGLPVYVVMEMMSNGNLRDFLRAHRPGAEENVDNRPLPTEQQFFLWAAQIADGMAYLQSIQFVHRDLAARNCMVNERCCVKIGDFGMARDMYYQTYYKPTGKRMMPVRWMSPEALKDGKFSIYSDVWSYGIVLYELLTLGQQPYAGLGSDELFAYIVTLRRTIAKPNGCPDVWYNLMRKCWKYDLRQRPSFFHIVHYLLPHVQSQEFAEMSIAKNDPDELFCDLYDKPYNFCPDVEDLRRERETAASSRPFALNDSEIFGDESDDGDEHFVAPETESHIEETDEDASTMVDSAYEAHPIFRIEDSDNDEEKPFKERRSFHHPRADKSEYIDRGIELNELDDRESENDQLIEHDPIVGL